MMVSTTDYMLFDDLSEVSSEIAKYNIEEAALNGLMHVAMLDWLDEGGPYVIHIDAVKDGRSQHGQVGNHCMYMRVNGDVF